MHRLADCCLTPAYALLAPAYGTVWAAGRHPLTASGLIALVHLSLGGVQSRTSAARTRPQ